MMMMMIIISRSLMMNIIDWWTQSVISSNPIDRCACVVNVYKV